MSDGVLATVVPNITVTESGGTTDVTEGANTDSFTIVLDTLPTNTVNVTVTPDAQTDVGAGAGTAIILPFTTANWNISQTVTVTAIDDVIVEGSHSSTILHSATSVDTFYNGISINSVTANITDNDSFPILTSEVVIDPQVVVANGVDTANITTTLIDGNNLAVSGKTITYSSDRGIVDTITQPLVVTDAGGVATGTIASFTIGEALITTTDTTDSLTLSSRPSVYFSQGRVLSVTKTANKEDAVVGDIVTYEIALSNTLTNDVSQVNLMDSIPPNFKYLKGSTRIDGVTADDPTGSQVLDFDIGTVAAFVDGNGNGTADSGEPGYLSISYQLVIGSGATPGNYTNSAVATDVCSRCYISNESEVDVEVVLDPIFDLGTIIGKVFEDNNRDGLQSEGEVGVAGAMVVLDNGIYVLTDEHGRYHFPAVNPGQRLVKLNLNKLPIGAVVTNDEIRILSVTEGIMAKANFGVNYDQDSVTIGRDGKPGIAVEGKTKDEPVSLIGNVEALTVIINGHRASLLLNDVKLGFEKY